jgi:hypothetical protein
MIKDLVIFQWPNEYLWTMILAWPIARFTTGPIHAVSWSIFLLAGIIWSYEEIAHGANWFRKILGLVVLFVIFMDLVKIIN